MNQTRTREPGRARGRWGLSVVVLALAPAACDSGAIAPDDAGVAGADAGAAPFSFFVASLAALQRLSGSQAGFGGDLRLGKPDGLSGADEICRQIAETSMPGAGAKGWRAMLSVTRGPDGNPVHAIDRVGPGPWYDRRGRLIALNVEDLIQARPKGAETSIANDLPNEDGVANHAPDGTQVDNHDILTGSDRAGKLYSSDWSHTCHDWTSAVGGDGQPRVGHSWTRAGGIGGGGPPFVGGEHPDGAPPFVINTRDGGAGMIGPPGDGGEPPGGMFPGGGRTIGGCDAGDGGPCIGVGPGGGPNGDSWLSTLDEAGCAPGVSLVEMGPPDPRNPTVGSGGGYGAIYCLALSP